ncbi:DUF1007 family protein [Roseobacter sp. SK209-2-6]|uniref:DUF1007 family protein n=1 Tax=Roseobacter sp. SK209-2-6 TaxID=388739 RepID=UPI0002FD0DBB|nr:DUF1007 family protein [Roseobacter sp. SK209-2-6]
MKPILASVLLLLPNPLQAHPHVFVDTGFEVLFDADNRLDAIKVTWSYDEFYSLLVTEDLGLDRDGDGKLTQAEHFLLTGFDTNWDEGFNGDLEVRAGEEILPLSGPLEAATEFAEGRIVSTHMRKVVARPPVNSGPFSIKAFDPSYYTAYEIKLPVRISGPLDGRCMLERLDPDIEGALAQMQAQLLRLDANADLEENDIPLLGAEFATEILITCPSS